MGGAGDAPAGPFSRVGNDHRMGTHARIRRALNADYLDRDASAPVPVRLRPKPLSVEDHHMRYRVLLTVMFLGLIGMLQAGQASAQSLVAAVLPSSRSVQVGSPATAFPTIINTGNNTALSVSISLQTSIPASFLYQTTDSQT